jgi:hypothetical protein
MCTASIIALMMETANTSETSVKFYKTTRRNNTEDSHLQLSAARIFNLTKYFTFVCAFVHFHPLLGR